MVNLCHQNLFLTLLLAIADCQLSMLSRERDYTICNKNPLYVSRNYWGYININHNKLEEYGKCTLTLKACEKCVISLFLHGEDVNGMCSSNIMCPCHLSSFSPNVYSSERYCYRRRCPLIKIVATPANQMVLAPSYQSNCQISTKSSEIYIDVCQSQTNVTGVNMMYKVDSDETTGMIRRPWFHRGEFLNFTMCMHYGDSALHLGMQGYIHLSNCSGKCVLALNSCSNCKIRFYMDTSNLTGNNQLRCLTIKISDKFKRGEYIRFSALQSNYLNYTTFSKAATLEICQGNIEGLQLKIFYEVIEKLETKFASATNITLLQIPSNYPPSDEIFKYYIKKSTPSGHLQLILTNYLCCADCYVVIAFGSSVFNNSQKGIRRVYTSKDTITVKYFTGKIQPGCGLKAEIRYFEDFNIITPNANCGAYQLVTTSGHFHFQTIYDIYYDCVWVLVSKPRQNFFEQIYFSLFVNASLSKGSHVDIHCGNTSEGQKLDLLKNSKYYYYPNLSAAYIRLQGLVRNQDRLNILFMVQRNQCALNTFPCMNGDCIPKNMRCNRRIDCSDYSDENGCSHFEDTRKSYPSYWSYSLIIIIVVTTFIILSLCLFFIFVCKIRRIRQANRRNSVRANHNHIRMNLTFEGERDAPPAYDEVMTPSGLQGNFNLAFNWSHSNSNEPSGMPPTYQEYMQQTSATDCVDSRGGNDEASSENIVQQPLPEEQEDRLQRESGNGNKDQTVPVALTIDINSVGNSLEISQPVSEVNVNSSSC
ncbi:uncharacterized protein LOC115220943 [Octopus sinensis]|uniref:Uncharacterized protein LOC115220943 n=1 Tax=Octopus sinensis TaxID=2607531 RepID=A0A7E6FFF9_9MOLL|nr:uncharacterized protein LOC115220943 [Octopus sinensis]